MKKSAKLKHPFTLSKKNHALLLRIIKEKGPIAREDRKQHSPTTEELMAPVEWRLNVEYWGAFATGIMAALSFFEETSPKSLATDLDNEGYNTPYANFLQADLDEIDKILGQLVLAHGEHLPLDGLIAQIEEWMGDDWDVSLSGEDAKRLDAIKGWTYD